MKKRNCAENVIKQILFKRGLKYDFICKNLGFTLGDFSACMSGKKKLNAAEFIALCVFLNLSLEDFKECMGCV